MTPELDRESRQPTFWRWAMDAMLVTGVFVLLAPVMFLEWLADEHLCFALLLAWAIIVGALALLWRAV